MTKPLSTQEHWEEVFAAARLPRTINLCHYNYYRFDRAFRSLLPRGPARFLEIGAGASAWLVYFANEFGYNVVGLDYSDVGCKIAKENLRLNRVDGEVHCLDLFDAPGAELGTFDVIFSYGVIEHFDDPARVLEVKRSLLRPGGIALTIAPNMRGLPGRLQRMWDREVFEMHRPLTPRDLHQAAQRAGLIPVVTKYFGTYFTSVVNWSRPAERPRWKRGVARGAGLAELAITRASRRMRIEPESRVFSPYVLSVARRAQEG